ncbi:MAB_1171c family putative transporter [Spirillospora sp. CA-294931]|uniref:MAB_1171c family putative transporter n=1 Tax=Spirillospora sp. CA-294931 TaxID=3240042 RepID=UPI003D91E71B
MNVVFPICAVVLTVILGYKFRYLRSQWSRARVWALCSTVFFFAVTMWFAFPASAKLVNGLVGVPNIAELLVASTLAALGASFLSLALLWRYPTEIARPKIQWVIAAYSLVIVTITVLFAISDVPVERPVDFTFYYARKPTIAAMYLIYYVSTTIGSAILARWCFTWARQQDYAELTYLRRGLLLYGGAGVMQALYSSIRLVTLAANWAGTKALDPIGNSAPSVCALIATGLLSSALLVPVWGPRWTPLRRSAHLWRQLLTLRRLHRALREVDPAVVFVAPGRRRDVRHRVRRAMIELSDWRWTLAPLFDPSIQENARDPVVVEAAQLRAALDDWRRGTRGGERPVDRQIDVRDGNDLDGELEWWCQVARAFGGSPAVEEALASSRSRRPHALGR